MPDLPEDVVAVEQEILDVLARSEARILVQQQAITDEIREGRKSARLDALLEQVRAEREVIETGTKNWLESAVPYTFNSGSVSTGLTDSAQWNRVNLSAVQEIIDFHYDEILAQTPYMEPAAKRWFRDAARAGNELSATTGLTRVQQARLIRSQAPQAFDPSGRPLPLAPVTYKNGSRHTMREYSNMLARTTTALTFNRGSLNTIEELGGAFVEVFDGADCGATGHDDPDLVNGTIRTLKWAQRHLISHPNAIMGGQVVETFGLPTEIVRARYSGPSVTVRTAQGHRLTVSPDHPIATPSGWVPARLLRPGDHVLCDCTNVEAVRNGADFYQQPLIEEVFAALVESFPNFTAVPAPDDLHGAAKCCDPEVDVVDPERLLLDHTLAEVAQMIGEAGLVVRDPKLPLEPGSGADLALLDALLASPHRLVGRSGRLTGVDLRGSELQSVGARQARQPGPCERLPEPTLGDVVLGGEIGEQFSAGGVAPMEIGEDVVVELAVGWHDGLVFDASTVGAAYLTSGVVVANCRRSFGARFDVTEEDLTQRSTSISREALADQARFERQLAARAATGRTARTGRVGRAAKKALEEARRQALAAAQAEARRRLLQEALRRFRGRGDIRDFLPQDLLQVPLAGDRFRRFADSDWRRPLANDFDEVQAFRTGISRDVDDSWVRTMDRRGDLLLPGDNQRRALDAQIRIGRTVNDEVDLRYRQRFADQLDFIDSGERTRLSKLVGEMSSDRSFALSDINAFDSINALRKPTHFTLRDYMDDVWEELTDRQGSEVLERILGAAQRAGLDLDLDLPLPSPKVLDDIVKGLVPKVDELEKARRELVDRIIAYRIPEDALAEIRLEVLSEIRDFGGEIRFTDFVTEGSFPLSLAEDFQKARKYMDEFDSERVSRWFPSDWIDKLNDTHAARTPIQVYDSLPTNVQTQFKREALVSYTNTSTSWIDDFNRFLPDDRHIGTWTEGTARIPASPIGLPDLNADEITAIFDGLGDVGLFDSSYAQGIVERYSIDGIELRFVGPRAHASPASTQGLYPVSPTINIGSPPSDAVMVHEIMHHMDYIDDRGSQGWALVQIRADDFSGNTQTSAFIPVEVINKFRSGEVFEQETFNYTASFPIAYTGRMYDEAAGAASTRSEVNTTGIQGYFFHESYISTEERNADGVWVKTYDRQFIDYLAGLLASM